MLAQFCPVVKPIAGNLPGICLVCFHFSQGVVPVVFDKLRIDCADKAALLMKKTGYRLIVPSGVLHDYPCLTVQAFQVVCQLLEFTAGVTIRIWVCYHFSKRTEDRHHALSFGNIDPCNIVHIDRSSSWICFGDQPFHHCRSNLFDDTGAPRRWLNLHKSNAANERLADGLHYGRYGPWRNTSGQDSLILTALATMRKKTRQAAVPKTVNN